MEAVISANHPLPIATGSSGFSSSFLRRQRKHSTTASSSSLTSTSTATGHHNDLPPPILPGIDHSARSIVAASSSPVRRKPLPINASPVILSRLSQGSSLYSPTLSPPPTLIPPPLLPQTPPSSRPSATVPAGRQSTDSSRQLETVDEVLPFVPRDLDRYPRGQSPLIPFPIDTSRTFKDIQQKQSDLYYGSINDDVYLPHGTPIHSRLSSEPIIPVLRSPPPTTKHKRSETMALQPPQSRPPPLHIDPTRSAMPSPGDRQPKTPGNKITSFFGWKTTTSPGAESTSTEISDTGRSPLPSPLPQSASAPSFITKGTSSFPTSISENNIHGFPLPPAPLGSLSGPASGSNADFMNKISELEAELREISSELAGSIRREMELEDLVERFQLESHNDANRRTSDYFSDSGMSGSIRTGTDGGKVEDIERIKRAAEQERAQLKVELSQKWQEERSRRAACESHVQILENQVQQFRAQRVDNSNLSSKTRELEVALEDTRRKLLEERQLKDNFEDLLTAMRVELEQLRNERDHFRDEVVPALQAGQANQKNRFQAIAEEDGVVRNRGSMVGLSRSNSLARVPKRSSVVGTGGLSRSNSISAGNNRQVESRESLADRVKDVEAQRDALHKALKSLLDRQAWQARENEKRLTILEIELTKAQDVGSPRKLGYEREVRNLREEINHLRRRADEALEQKWQCEKGLGGLKMDLDRAEQETTSLRMLLQEHDIALPAGMDMASNEEGLANMQITSSALESAYHQLQAEMESAEAESWSPEDMNRNENLAGQVRQQLETNNALRRRLAEAIAKGEREQKMSASRINEMQTRLRKLEDTLVDAQHHSEDEMTKHEEEVRALKESHSVQLMRAKMGIKTPVSLSPNPAASPFSGARSPRLDVTTTGEGVPLSEAVSVAKLEVKVKELEKALRDADFEMEEVVQRMNKAQIEVAELQSDRDEALRQTRRLEAAILAEREKVKQ
ncbi:hypothetical protein EYB25_007897 [Talaromyces marneffei]|nr:hypothetical protein EYB25_007897 [Talaromyces marneffei]